MKSARAPRAAWLLKPTAVVQRLLQRVMVLLQGMANQRLMPSLCGLLALSVIISLFGIVNTLVLSITERTREIGIMRAIGATKKTVRRLFRVEAGVLGFMGGLFGVAISFGFAVGLNQVLNKQLADSGITDRNIVSISPQIALIVLLITTLIGMLAGSLPARRAANMDPVEALRYE